MGGGPAQGGVDPELDWAALHGVVEGGYCTVL